MIASIGTIRKVAVLIIVVSAVSIISNIAIILSVV